MRPLVPNLTILQLLILLLVPLVLAFSAPRGSSHVVRSIFPSFRDFPCPSPPLLAWDRPAAALLLDWSRAATGTVVVATFDSYHLSTFDASSGDLVAVLLPPQKMSEGCVDCLQM
jgi:hypothetical protein